MSVICIGATFVDYKGYSKNTYIPKGRNEGSIEIKHGGVVRNVSENLSKMNIDTTLVTLVSDDQTGKSVIQHLDDIGVHTQYIRKTKQGMGCWLAVFDESNDVVASISSRPNLLPLTDLLNNNPSIIENSDAIVLEMDIDIEVVDLVFQLADKYNKKIYGIISNVSIVKERLDYIHKTELFVCNKQEASLLFNCDLSQYNYKQMIDTIQSLNHPNTYIITLGDQGAIYVNQNDSGYIAADQIEVLDTTGAGDGFFSGVVAGLLENKSLKESCIQGKSVASKVIQSKENVL